MEAVEPINWEDIDVLNPVFLRVKEIIQILESDSFGTISYILRAISVFKDSVEFLLERFNDGKKAANVKITKIWKKSQHLWDPILFATCRLDPSMDVNLIMETSQINKGDRYILSMMKNPAPIEVMEKPTKITNPLCCFSSNVIESIGTTFEIYKKKFKCVR